MIALLALLFSLATDCEPTPYGDRAALCEVRTFALDADAPLIVRSPVGGTITVQAWDRDEISVRAEVSAYATHDRQPEDLLAATRILTDGVLQPETEGGGWVETAFVISVPAETDLDLQTNNGVIAVTGVTGTLRIDTNNGVVRLADVSGHVDARSNNGDVLVDLGGATWSGTGLRAFANNGTLRLRVPERYNARLDADVRWGSIGEPDANSPSASSRTIYFGAGGPTIRAGVNSGSIQIERGS